MFGSESENNQLSQESKVRIRSKQVWWRVDLGQSITIQYITIYYRATTGYRFGGYSLYVSNSTNHIEGILCYQDNRSNVNVNPTHLCPYVAQYVTVYNHREEPKRHDWYSNDAILELCEVQVFGCQIGSYGNQSCNNPCPESCYGGNCNAITGSCFYCFPGMFGEVCEQNCSANCNSTCEKDTGHCIGCIPGKRGDLCDANCPVNCVACEQTSEKCFGCIPDKRGDLCDANCPVNCVTCEQTSEKCFECVNGKYGDVCDIDCSDTCTNKSCTKGNGYCLAGCIPGKKGNLCDTSCSSNCATCDQTSEQCYGNYNIAV
ncbi:protein draper-like [Mizuhopecten yessoensis]|uniref:protein draper-like n=1 Tax=Mizuhopecten yessoensis TaxID=6573 RepID=UPI000B45A0FB|nr:protein draper-like [Mizuhopecten yessoensis]